MRLLLVDNLLFEGDSSNPVFDLQPHLGLLSLAAVAQGGGIEVEILDPKLLLVRGALTWGATLYQDLAGLILDRRPDIVGFTALGCNFHCVVQVAMAVHGRRPKLPLILGGPHASILHRQILERLGCFAAVVRHEAEGTLLPLLDALGGEGVGAIPGVSWRHPDGRVICNSGAPQVEDLDVLPVPAYDASALEGRQLSSIRVEAGRGCPFSCTFCSTASFFGRSYRLKSAARLVAEMDMLADQHGFDRFKLNHDLFTVNRRKVLEFCEAVEPRGYRWACSARVDCVDNDLLEAMHAAGCRDIYFGIETGSALVQRSSRKRLDLNLVGPVLACTGRLGIATTTSFIIGYPDEAEADRADTLDLAGRLHLLPGNVSQVHLLTPEPGTDMIERYRATLTFDEHRCGFNLPRFAGDDDRLIAAEPDLFVTHFHYAGLVPHARNIFAAALWRQLATTSRSAFEILLSRWGGRLSALLDDAEAWWGRRAGNKPAPDADALTAFAREWFGASAPVVSILRFEDACRNTHAAGRTLSSLNDGPSAKRAAMSTILLRDIHNVPAMGDVALDSATIARTHLVVVHGAADEIARAYEVDGVTADLLTILDRPGGEDFLKHVDPAAIEQLVALQIVRTSGR